MRILAQFFAAIALACLAPSVAQAQCNGQFPAGTICGNATVGGPPRPQSLSSFGIPAIGSLPSTAVVVGGGASPPAASSKFTYDQATNTAIVNPGLVGVNTATPGSTNSDSGYPCVLGSGTPGQGTARGCLDVGGVLVLHAEQNSYYAYGSFASTAYFGDFGPNAWGWAIGNLGTNTFGIIYTTESFKIGSPNNKLSQVWTPSWTYLQNPVAATGVNPSFSTGPAFGWGFSTLGATDIVNKNQSLGGTDFVFSNWNDVAMKNIVFIRSTGANLEVHSQNAMDIPLIIKAATSQSAALTFWRDSSNNAVASVDKDGYFTTGITSGVNLSIGNNVATGIFGDGGNIALRTYPTTAKIFFQNASGAATFGDWDTTRLAVANATASTTSANGAIVVTGGAGIGGAVHGGAELTSATFVGVGTKIRANGTAPALTSCGTSPAIVGSDLSGEVTMGTGSPTGCIITFNAAYVSAPLCNVTWQATPLASQSYAVSNTAITLTQTGTSSNKVNYTCMARSGG